MTTILEVEPPARRFSSWTMAFRDLGDPTLPAPPGYETIPQLAVRIAQPTANIPLLFRLLHTFVADMR